MGPDTFLERPVGFSYSRWKHMSPRERAHAWWLALEAGWARDIDVARHASYDTDSNVTLVEFELGNPTGAAAWGACSKAAEEWLAAIEARYGAEARRRAEETIADTQHPVPGGPTK